MRFDWIIGRYLAREVALYTTLGFLAAAPVVMVPNLLARADEFLVAGVTLRDQLDLAMCVIPLVVGYALPIAFLFGAMLAIGRLSGDLEITAMRCCGFGTGAILIPILALGALVSAFTAYLMIEVEPRAKRGLIEVGLRVAARGSLIEEGRFVSLGRRMIYVRRRYPDLRLEGVMISDSSQDDRTFHVFAERGQFVYDDESGDLTLRLENGDMRMQPGPSIDFREYRISFEQFDYTFLAMALGYGELRYRMDQLGFSELRNAVARIEAGDRPRELKYRSASIYSTQLHRILSVPLASVLLAWVGVPLGMNGFVRSRAWGMIMALALLVGYYSLFVYVQDASRMGLAPAYLLVWIPNATLLVAGAALVWGASRIR